MNLTERHLVNAIVGLCKPTKFWPHDLHDLGYTVHSIEQAFTNSQGTTVTPDIIVSNKAKNHALVFECKSGGYVKQEQIDKYPQVTDRDVSLKALVPSANPSEFRADLTIFCLDDKFPSLRRDLEEADWPCPIIALAPGRRIALLMNTIREQETDGRLRGGIQLQQHHRLPTHYVPIMSSHASDHELASTILPHMVARVRSGDPEFAVVDLCTEVFKDMWGVIDPAEQHKLGTRFAAILSLASKTDLRGVLKRLQGSKLTERWQLETPADRKNDQAYYRSLRTRAKRLLSRLSRGGSKLDKHYTQLTPDDVMKEFERRSRDESNDPESRSG